MHYMRTVYLPKELANLHIKNKDK